MEDKEPQCGANVNVFMAPCKVLVKQNFFAASPQFSGVRALHRRWIADGSPVAPLAARGTRVMAAQQWAGWHDLGMAPKGFSDSVNGVANPGFMPVVKVLLVSLNEG